MSLISTLFGMPSEVFGEMRKPYADRPDGAGRRPVENFDIATILLRMGDGASGAIQVSRCAWGRKGRLQLQIFGAKGAILFDQERFNEVSVYLAEGPTEGHGFRTVLMGPTHPPYDRFIVAPGHQMGFNDLKIVEAHELLNRIAGKPSLTIDFDAGLAIEHAIHAAARSAAEGRWVEAGRAGQISPASRPNRQKFHFERLAAGSEAPQEFLEPKAQKNQHPGRQK